MAGIIGWVLILSGSGGGLSTSVASVRFVTQAACVYALQQVQAHLSYVSGVCVPESR